MDQVQNNDQRKQNLYNSLVPFIDVLLGVTLLPIDFHQRVLIVNFSCPITNTTGQTLILLPNEQGMMTILSGPSRFDGYFIDVNAHNIEQIIDIIQFSQELLRYQPDEDDLEHVRVPNHMLDHWCISLNYHNFVLNGYV